MADDGRKRRNGFVTWEPGHGDGHATYASEDGPSEDGPASSDGRGPGGGDGATPRRGDRPGADLGRPTADGRGPEQRADGRAAEARGAHRPERAANGARNGSLNAPSNGHHAGGQAAAPNGRGLGAGLLDPLPPKRTLQEEPGRTMAETHLSSAPPELGPVRRSLDENKAILDTVMGVGTSYDVIFREFRFGETRIATYVLNGMYTAISNMVLLNMTQWLTDISARRSDIPPAESPVEVIEALFDARLAYSQVTKTANLSDVVFQVMSGPIAFLVDGAEQAIIVDTREYPDRQPDEPDTERVIRGPHDGFIETLVFNTILIRRRIRDPRLRFEVKQVGVRGQMDVAIGYIEGLTDPGIVEQVKKRLERIDIDGVPMAERTVAEYLSHSSWNPFPTVRYTERPDVAAFHLLEGHVLVLVDTSPQAIICPSTLWNHLHHPEDYHLSPFMGTYMRWVQFVGMFFATLVPPIWLLIAIDPRIVHALPGLGFIGPKKPSGFPLGLQFVGAEVTLDLLRRAILNTPGTLSATMGILGAIVLGDVAAKTGLFSSEVLVYLILAAIGQFAISNLELGMATRIIRLTLLIAVWALRLPGLLIGSLVWLLVLLGTRTFGVPYTWPLIPFDWVAMRGMLLREPAHARSPRPRALRVQDRTRR